MGFDPILWAKMQGIGSGGGGTANAVQYIEQSLTDEQKAQARENIGASNVEIDGEGFGNTGKAMDSMVAMAAFSANAPGALTWDGVIGDKYYISLNESDGVMYALVRVTEDIPSIEFLSNMGASHVLVSACSQGAVSFAGMVEMVSAGDQLLMIGEGACIALCDTTLDNLLLKKGVYFQCLSFLPSGYDTSLSYCNGLMIPCCPFDSTVSWNNLKDKPFGDSGETFGSVVVNGNTLSWNGDTADLVSSVVVSSEAEGYTWYRVHSDILTKDNIAEGLTVTTSIDGIVSSYTLTSEDAQSAFADDGAAALADNTLLCIPTDNYNYDGLAMFPKAGVYFINDTPQGVKVFCTGVSIPGYTFASTVEIKKIDPKYLPDSISGVTTLYADNECYLYYTQENISDTTKRIAGKELLELYHSGGSIRVYMSQVNASGTTTHMFLAPHLANFEEGTDYTICNIQTASGITFYSAEGELE